ncbi:MAG: hypothetical protein WCI05_13135 [Myxococcales bacterium]
MRIPSAGATLIRDLSSQGLPTQLGGFLTGRWLRLLRHGRIDFTGSAATGTYVDQFGWSFGPGASLLADKLDIALYYRQGIFRYRPNDTVLLQHALGTSVMVWPRADVALALQGEGVGGDDSQFLYVFASAVWRPRL